MEEIIVGRVVPPQETLMSGTYEGNLIWKKDLCRCNQAKIRSYWIRVCYNPVTGVLIRRGKFGHRHRGRLPRDNRGRDWADAVVSQE